MIAVIETTVWDWEYQPNHTYLLDGDRIVAYIPKGSKTPKYFTGVLRINRSGRKFQELKVNPFKKQMPEKALIKVQGSKGNTYEIDPVEKSCTCPGFMYKSKCKHIEAYL